MASLSSLMHRIRQDPRLARMLHGGLSSLLGRGIGIVISAISLPLTVRYLGKLEYGVWITISSSVVMFSVLDLGIANTLTNFISTAYAADDREAAQGYFATAFWLTMGVAAVLATLCLGLFLSLNWGSLLGLTGAEVILHARRCVALSMIFFVCSLPLNLVNRVLGGYQQAHITNYFAMANSILGLAAIVITMALHGTIVHLTLAYCSAMLAGSVALNLWLAIRRPWLRPYPGKARRPMARALFGQGALFFVLQLTSIVVFNTDNLVITHYLGAAEVTPYSVAWRLTSYAALLQSMLIPSLWPAFTEAYHKRDLDWVRRTYRRMARQTTLAVAAVALLMGLAGRAFIRVWAGAPAVPPPLLLWTMVAFAILVSVTTNQALLLTATGRLRLEATVAVLAAIANLALSIFLVQRIGAEGVILSTLLSFAILMVGPQQREVNRVLRGEFFETGPVPAREEVLIPLAD